MQFHTNIWYLLKTKSRMEEMAAMNLKNQRIEYFLPRFTFGKREGKVIFPGYIFFKPKTGNTSNLWYLTKLKEICTNDIVGLRNKLLLQLG